MHEQARDDLHLRVRLLHLHQVLLAVVLAGLEDYTLHSLLYLLLEVVVARHEVVKLLHVLQGELDAALPPRRHEEHGLALEVLDILVAEGFVVVVLEDLEAVGGLELAVV